MWKRIGEDSIGEKWKGEEDKELKSSKRMCKLQTNRNRTGYAKMFQAQRIKS